MPTPLNTIMQLVLALFTLLVGAALAGPMTVLAPDDLVQENRAISSREYLKKIFEGKVSVPYHSKLDNSPLDKYEKIVYTMGYLGLFEAIDILEKVNLPNLLQDIDLDYITLYLPTDEAIKKWRMELPASLEPSQSDLEELVKAWIVYDTVFTYYTWNNDVLKSVNGALLRFNIIQQEVTTVNGARIITADQQIPGSSIMSVIQVLDKVIYPLPTDNVVKTLVDVPAFSKFIELVDKAELAKAMSDSDPITMFVPTNAAVRALPDIEDLMKNKTKLVEILKYHVHLQGTRYSSSMPGEERISTVHGAFLTITPGPDGKIYLNKEKGESKVATILAADIPATNGVLHIIDRVLTPPERPYILV